ncbi:MAG: PDZ domain-containing protein [Bryobacterales bacterium]|nr:PDZ domain-containing protein [Bryobacterales bacterium]
MIQSKILKTGVRAALAALAVQAYLLAQPAPAPRPMEDTFRMLLLDGRSFLGVGVAEIDAERSKALKLKDEYGVEVTRIEDDSPAARAGLKVNDVILEYNGQRVEGTEQFVRFVRETPAGRTVKLLVSRNGATQTIAAILAARKPKAEAYRFEFPNIEVPVPDIPQAKMSWRSSMLGVEAESLESQLAAYFGVKEGVLVRAVNKSTVAERAGLKAGDVLLKVDDTKVMTPRDVTSAIRAARAKDKKQVSLLVMRDKHEITLNATFEDEATSEKPAIPRSKSVTTQRQL